MVSKGKYTILEYPELDDPSLHTVKVVKVYTNPKHGRIVRYRFNWPFPITREVREKEFESWIAAPTKKERKQ